MIVQEQPREGKQERIARLLSQGRAPAELVQEGYSRGTVYKVARRLQADAHGGLGQGSRSVDSAVESDSEIVALKKRLRKAELERQLREAQAPTDLEQRVAALEACVSALREGTDEESFVHILSEDLEVVEQRLASMPLVVS